MDEDLERPGCALPTVAVVAVAVLALVGVVTVVGWIFSLAWAVIRLGVILVVVVGLVAAWRAATGRR